MRLACLTVESDLALPANLVEVGGKGGEYKNDASYRDVISGRIFNENIKLDPYEVLVLEKMGE